MGLDISKVNEQVARKYAAGLLGLFAKAQTTPIKDILDGFEKHFSAQPSADLSDCTACGGSSSVAECDVCPYCGAADDDGTHMDAHTDVETDPLATTTTTEPATATVIQDTTGNETTDTGNVPEKSKKMTTAQQPNGITKTNSKAMKKKGAAAPSEAQVALAKKGAEVSTALAPAPKLGLAGMSPTAVAKANATVKDLDDAVAHIQQLRGSTAVEFHKLGTEVRRIYEADLWRLRATEGGKPLYKTFEQFCAEEVQLNKAFVYRLMDISKQFDVAQIAKYGTTNLRALLAAPKDDRDRIMGQLDTGEVQGTRAVEAEVKKARKAKGMKARKGVGKSGKTAKASAAAAATRATKAKVTTIAIPEGKTNVKLFVAGNAEKRAKRLADKPEGVLVCENGVTMTFKVRETASGELVLVLDSKR